MNLISVHAKRLAILGLSAAAVGLPGLTSACIAETSPPAAQPALAPSEPARSVLEAPANVPPPLPAAQAPARKAANLKPLKMEPGTGFVGDRFTISAEGFAPGKEVEFQWKTVEGAYDTKVTPDNVEYVERKYLEKRLRLGRATADPQGRVTFSAAAPEDHGETHDVFAVVEGEEAGKGGFRILRTVSVSPLEGPVGTPVTIVVRGMASSYYQSTMAVRWDNQYTGFVSTVTTLGSGIAQIRAAGPPGEHVLQVYPASHATPYLNSHQGPNWHIFGHLPEQFTFKVTEDRGAPPDVLQWPDPKNVARLSDTAARTGASGVGTLVAMALPAPTLQPSSGPVLSRTTLQARGLAPDAEVELLWVTARGNRATTSGWSLQDLPLVKARTSGDGSLQAAFEIPDDLGGWHTVKLVGDGSVLSEIPYYVERSLLQVSPRKVKPGEQFTIQIKGIGWTELDNGVSVTYDNGFVGYACGFNSNGDITLYLTATGGPGTHLIDLYPMVYEGHPNKQVFNFSVPHLTALQDAPGLTLGYNLPIFRLAIEVAE